MHDNELVYLFQSENLSIAKQILFDKYFNGLLLASLNYWKQYPLDYQPLNKEDLVSLNYLAFHQTLYTYDVKNTKYDFKQALFIINRSIVGHKLKYYLNHNGQRILNHAYSFKDQNDLSLITQNQHHWFKTPEHVTNKIFISQIMIILTQIFKHIKNKQKIGWYWDRINGMDLKTLKEKYHVDPITISKFVYFINNQVKLKLKNQSL